MHAVTTDPQRTDPDGLTWAEVPTPEPSVGEVLIRTGATALNRADLLQRQGLYPPPPGASPILGLECSGTVVAVGPRVDGDWVGRRVAALLEGGGYAEFTIARPEMLIPIDNTLGDIAAAAIPEALATCWLNLFVRGRLSIGETVLVQAGTSGIGTWAIQLARASGARVIATAGSDEKRQACLALGADAAFDYASPTLNDDLLDASHGAGIDVVLDNVGPSNLNSYAEVLATGGRILGIGTQGGRDGTFNAGPLMAKQAEIHLTSLRRTPPAAKERLIATLRERALPLLAAGSVAPVVGATCSFESANRAHALLEEGGSMGKLVLAHDPNGTLAGVHPISPVANTIGAMP